MTPHTDPATPPTRLAGIPADHVGCPGCAYLWAELRESQAEVRRLTARVAELEGERKEQSAR